MKKYAFFDIDGTLYDGIVTSGFYLFLAERELAPNFVYEKDKEIGRLYYSGKIDYPEATRRVIKLMARVLKDKQKRTVDRWKMDFIKTHPRFFPWVERLFSLLKKKKYDIYLISAASSPSIEAVAEFLGVEKAYGSKLVVNNGIYTGKVERVLDGQEKINLIQRVIDNLGECYKIGFGDTIGDLEMLSFMDIAFLHNPQDEKLKKIAKKKGWHTVNKNNILRVVKSKI